MVPSVNIPIPTIDSMGGEFTYQPPWDPIGFDRPSTKKGIGIHPGKPIGFPQKMPTRKRPKWVFGGSGGAAISSSNWRDVPCRRSSLARAGRAPGQETSRDKICFSVCRGVLFASPELVPLCLFFLGFFGVPFAFLEPGKKVYIFFAGVLIPTKFGRFA